MLMQSVYSQKGKVMFRILEPLPWKQSLKKSKFQGISGIFPDLLTLKVNIK